ncbi:hypothetical protein V474_14040 [Novosphingobium barchaimii LL02]|uniref:Uncharacterized protein n=1 Tax=Novosphingobium barchaimii LL02 TaxID=1114963 RepID=A0A0J8AQD4_9SPHN|nr:hypothetical protein V474_14040 [Novosphingobium barchaimii LL02]
MLALTLAGGWAAAAQATESWIIAGGGDKPERDLFVVDAQSISDKDDFLGFMQSATPQEQSAYLKQSKRKGKLKKGEVRVGPDEQFDIHVDQVFESAAKPNRISSTYLVNCTRMAVSTTFSQVQWRHKKIEIAANRAAHAPASFGEMQVMKFVCNRGKDGRERDPAKAPKNLGFLFIGDTGLSPADFIWERLWTDSKRPPFTYRPSAAEIAESQRRLQESMTSALNTATGVIDAHQRDTNRVGRNNTLEMWIGKTEQDFAKVWGAPDRYVDGYGGVRTLYFRKGYVNRGSNVYGQVISEDHHWCDVTVETRSGIIKDYSTSGNSCSSLIR